MRFLWPGVRMGAARFFLHSACLILLISFPVAGQAQVDKPGFETWAAIFDNLPQNREKQKPLPEDFPLSDMQMASQMEGFVRIQRGLLQNAAQWIGGEAPPVLGQAERFYPFAQRLRVPSGSRIFFHGDLHGDVHSLLAEFRSLQGDVLQGFNIRSPDVYFVFLGDYVDRGHYGVEVIYTLLRFKEANPDRVFMVRGNHENQTLNIRFKFDEQWTDRFGETVGNSLFARMQDLYAHLPLVLYVGQGTDYLQCNHGGLEPGYRPTSLLQSPGPIVYQKLGRLDRPGFLSRYPELMTSDFHYPDDPYSRSRLEVWNVEMEPVLLPDVGFSWNDFTLLAGDRPYYKSGRGWRFGQDTTQATLSDGSSEGVRLRGVFRAHQQSSRLTPMMRRMVLSRGVFRHWQKGDDVLYEEDLEALEKILETEVDRPLVDQAVYTFNISPDSAYGANCGFDFGTIGVLTIRKAFDDWRLKIRNTTVPMRPGQVLPLALPLTKPPEEVRMTEVYLLFGLFLAALLFVWMTSSLSHRNR
ncbi:MAG: metallophosphoesterase family protein [Verrucomicrobiota bacterium]